MEIIKSGLLKESWSREAECDRCQCVVRVGMSDLFQMPGGTTVYACWECPECAQIGDVTPMPSDFAYKLPTRYQPREQRANNK